MPTLLLEIGCEEIPASACREAERQLPDLCEEHLGARPAAVYVGPRRVAAIVEDVPETPPAQWVKGPPESMRDRAAAGFAKRYGVAVEDLELRDGFLGVEVPGKPLDERIDELLRGFAFAKTMRWDASGLRFPRPIRWVTVKLGAETIRGGTSFGHRVTHGEVEIADAASYAETLRAADVEPDAAERRRLIVEALPEGWSDPLGKLEEVVYLVERPTVLEGTFDEGFLELPPRVIETAMQSHQRYFPLGGNRFAVVINGGDPEVALAGHRRVLENRLADARFTFDRDVEHGIEALAAQLGSITFLAGAGSFADKTERVAALVERLGGDAAAKEAARLAKADQAAELVREFPDLEGHIGSVYARRAGQPDAVAAAIEEQYLPDSAGGPLPLTKAGRVLAAADKIDNLVTAFGLGKKPTGSRDPYGLRRAAIGLCRLATEGGLAIPLEPLGEAADFVEERFEGLLTLPVEYVRAARASGARELGEVARLAEGLYAARETPEFDAVYTAYERASRLAGKAEEEAAPSLDPALLADDAEQVLAAKLGETSLRPTAGDLNAAAELAPLVERFFEETLVMAEDPKVRANRLRLLLDVRDTLLVLGDFSQIPR